ncbi:MAG: PQQ-dependent sugar dehydrogenase, partial [Planctomycetales bacterium]|nr:PQQ-dependent sugar dehydrogenase [Planctomycetales bacterium]
FGPGTFDERGFLGFAFHPNYATNGLIYTYMSQPATGAPDFSTIPMTRTPNHQAVIGEWRTMSVPPDANSVIDPTSFRELLRVDEPQFNHNAGAINFGPDGMLYIAFGDGGSRDDQDTETVFGHGNGNGQNRGNPLGSVLRIDPSGNNSANGNYGIPADNPFVGEAGVVEEIFAYGLRNPFRFSFDSANGDLWLADVGQGFVEEVDIVTSGGNYGWNAYEGSPFFVPDGNQPGFITNVNPGAPLDVVPPIAEYDHEDGIAIIGGFVYRGSRIPPLIGRYVFGEFASTFSNDGRLFYLDDTDTIVEFNLVGATGLGHSLLGMGQDGNGELYALVND